MPDFEPWFVTYYCDAEYLWQDVERPPTVKIGDGVILEGGARRFRVQDIWHSYDQQGAVDHGTHVYLVDVTDTDDDLPAQMNPGYYRPSAG